MSQIINIAVYKFVPLTNLKQRRESLRRVCKDLSLKGTILLSTEGINLFIAGTRESIDRFLATLQEDPAFEELTVKESVSDYQPFSRMLVKIKKEIIAFDVDGIDPISRTSKKIAPAELKAWLDEGRPVTLLDTRNDYEVKIGTFKNALPIGVDNFRDFPEAVGRLADELKQQPIVMFCTGGIRCEKAGPFMEKEGFEKIYQLDGGILKYFEDCGGDHYDGECFVFDKRVALDAALEETDAEQCFNCLAVLTPQEQQSPEYVPGESCPYCYKSDDERRVLRIEDRHDAIKRVTNPLPGSVPYDNKRPMSVPGRCDGADLLDFLTTIYPRITREQWVQTCRSGRLCLEDTPVDLDTHPPVRGGERYHHLIPATVEPDVNADIKILHEDDCLIVINKPAPLPMHPCGRFNRNTLSYILSQVYGKTIRSAHRLDANTSGVLVMCTTRHTASLVHPQFEHGKVHKRYLALVAGSPQDNEFECDAPISQEPGVVGTRTVDPNGLPARTKFTVIDRLDDGTTLLEACPLTGRTNQIRIHLWHLGMPIVGDPIYLPDQAIGERQTLSVDDPPLCLHAASITLKHPRTKETITFDAPLPSWAMATSGANAGHACV